MPTTYCGNNARNENLRSGRAQRGSRVQCLRKGVAVGGSMPYDEQYAGPFQPIDPTRFYCGNSHILPAGYDSMGSPARCLQKGVGIGRARKARQGAPYWKWAIIGFISLVLISALFLVLYFTKPKFLRTDTKDSKSDKIDWGKFMALYIPLCFVIILASVGIIIKFFR